MQETWVWSLGWEDPLEKEMVMHSSVLAWKIQCTEEAGELQFRGLQSQTQLSNWTTEIVLKLCHLPPFLILMRFLDNFHYYLASKFLEFIRFAAAWMCINILILIFIMALENLEFAIFVLVSLTASLLPNFKNLLHYSKGIKKFSLQNWIDSLPKWKVRVKDAHSSFCLVASLVVCRNLLDFYLKLCLTLSFKIMFWFNGLWIIIFQKIYVKYIHIPA